MFGVKTKKYTFVDENGETVNIDYSYTENTRKLLKKMTGVDIESIDNLKDAKLVKLLFKAAMLFFISKVIIWISVTAFLVYSIFTEVEVIGYVIALLFWLVFTW